MRESELLVTRRKIIHFALAMAGGAVLRPWGALLAAEGDRVPTPEVALGPFYPVVRGLEKDGDLTRVRGRRGRAEGTLLEVSGRVLNLRGEPVRGVRLEMWQADTRGRYAHPSDERTLVPDPNFQGFGVQKTDREGRYRFRTIKPGSYPVSDTESRTPHLHFDIQSDRSRLVTQMFFPGEALNATDMLFRALGTDAPAATGVIVPPGREGDPDAIHAHWDIILFER